MREYSTPLPVAPAAEASPRGGLADDVARNAAAHPGRATIAHRDGAAWVDVDAATFHTQVRDLARGLIAAGVGAGDRVALWAPTSADWTRIDYALWYAGAVSVPIYDTAAADQVAAILSDARCALLVTDGGSRLDALTALWDGDPDAGRDLWPRIVTIGAAGPGSLAELVASGAGVSVDDVEARRAAVVPTDLATILYTSGTTGTPRGCRLTHGHLDFEISATTAALGELFDDDHASTLLVLPLAHVFARIVQIGAIRSGVRLGHSADIRRLGEDLQTFEPSFLLGVPRIFEKVFTRFSQEITAEGRGKNFDRAVRTAIAWSNATEDGSPGRLLRTQHAAYDRLFYSRFRAALGGRCRYAICGGAPLGDRLGHFFRGAGVPVLEGYGLTESSGAATVNTPTTLRVGTVGRPIPGTTVRVSDDGELLLHGPHVFGGYWGELDDSDTVSEGGWLRTGDLGEIDNEGFVRVTGRRKEILVTSGGKNVAPVPLEDIVSAHPLVAQALVVGDGRPYVAALVTLDRDAVTAWAAERGVPADLARLAEDPGLLAAVQTAVDSANATVSRAESIRAVRVLPVEWTEEGGQLTPSLKLRRHRVARDHRAEILALYDT